MLKKNFLFLGLAIILTSQINAATYKIKNKTTKSRTVLCIYDNGEKLSQTIESHDELILRPIKFVPNGHEYGNPEITNVESIYIFKSFEDINRSDDFTISNYLFVLSFKNPKEDLQKITIHSDNFLMVETLTNLED